MQKGVSIGKWEIIQGPQLEKAKRDAEKKRTLRKAGQKPARGRRAVSAGKRESEKEKEEEAAAQPEAAASPQGRSGTRQPSEQQRFREWFEKQRREALNGSYSEDDQLPIGRLNKLLVCLKDYDEAIVAEAAHLYFAEPYRRQQDPPCSLRWFAVDRAQYLSKAKRVVA